MKTKALEIDRIFYRTDDGVESIKLPENYEVRNVWTVFKGYSKYAINPFGYVINITTGRYIRPQKCHNGYMRVIIRTDDKQYKHLRVGVMVASAYCLGYKPGLEVDHIDMVKTNDIYTNLRWVTPTFNRQHKKKYTQDVLLKWMEDGKITEVEYQELVRDI